MKKFLFLFVNIIIGVNISFGQSEVNDLTKDALLQSALKEAGVTFATNGNASITSFVSFSSKENTRGSRYLFPDWVKGSVVDSAGSPHNNKYYLFNYDKISHILFLTTDTKSVIEIDPRIIRSFTLKNNSDIPYSFEKIPSINPNVFFQAIVGNSGNYSAYKLTTTKFEKANYKTDGMVETGKNYDEYADASEYYVGMKNGTEYKKVDLNRKALKRVFAENPTANVFFSEHKDDEVNENYLKDLINFLNKILDSSSDKNK